MRGGRRLGPLGTHACTRGGRREGMAAASWQEALPRAVLHPHMRNPSHCCSLRLPQGAVERSMDGRINSLCRNSAGVPTHLQSGTCERGARDTARIQSQVTAYRREFQSCDLLSRLGSNSLPKAGRGERNPARARNAGLFTWETLKSYLEHRRPGYSFKLFQMEM